MVQPGIVEQLLTQADTKTRFETAAKNAIENLDEVMLQNMAATATQYALHEVKNKIAARLRDGR